jgi:hypothetical protein
MPPTKPERSRSTTMGSANNEWSHEALRASSVAVACS